MIYELRTYWAMPEKEANLHERFRSVTMRVFKRNNIEVVGFCVPVPITPESGTLVYLLRFASEEAKDKAWKSFQNDAEWIEGKAASEKDGKLVAKMTSVILKSTDYAPAE